MRRFLCECVIWCYVVMYFMYTTIYMHSTAVAASLLLDRDARHSRYWRECVNTRAQVKVSAANDDDGDDHRRIHMLVNCRRVSLVRLQSVNWSVVGCSCGALYKYALKRLRVEGCFPTTTKTSASLWQCKLSRQTVAGFLSIRALGANISLRLLRETTRPH